MIATGTDVKPIECLIFMRDVRSKNYFEQMKGRGTRNLDKDDLQKVTPSATENKDHFVIVDAVGVTKSKKSDTRTLERKEELFLDFGLATAKDVPKLLDEYVHYYNYERPAAALGYKSPVQYKTELGF